MKIKKKLIKAFHIDCGRKYFTIKEIKDIIDLIEKYNYNTLELAFGNDGQRFLLDNMEIEFDSHIFSSENVKKAIQAGNKKYANFEVNELTESEMNEIIYYANNRNISIIPLVNSPGHMDSILYACTILTKNNCSYLNSSSTIDISNKKAVKFALAFVNKFINYFKEKNSTMFNMGGDEYANDIFNISSKGFGHLIEEGKYNKFIDYMNLMAKQIKEAGMIPVAFNDGFYFNENIHSGQLDLSFVISYWYDGWNDYHLMPANKLRKMGYKILNTNRKWYYVLNWKEIKSGKRTFEKDTLPGVKNVPYNKVIGNNGYIKIEGCMICFWCDEPLFNYDEKEKGYLETQISEFSRANTDIF